MARFPDLEHDIHAPIHIDRPPACPDNTSSSEILSPSASERQSVIRNRLALVVFSLGNSEGGYTYSAHIVWKLLSRREQFREIGWFDDCHIGVFITGATLAEAMRFAESLRREIPEEVPLRYRVYCSPGPRYRNHGDRRDRAGIPAETDVRFTSFARVYGSEALSTPAPYRTAK